MNKDTVIIVAVCAAVAAVALLYTSVRIVRRFSSTSNPLPPPQPLAHLREQELAKFEGSLPRSQTWYQANHLSAPSSSSPSSARGSRTSLLAKHSPDPNLYSPVDFAQSLPPPNPSFHSRPGSSSSSSDHSHAPPVLPNSANFPSSPPTPPLEPPTPRHGRSASSSPSPARRSRPLSVASSQSTIFSKASRNTLRGAPHGPFSQIQIVLPAPLASDLPSSASADRLSRIDGDAFDRRSVVDRWVSAESISPLISNSPPPSVPSVPRIPAMYLAPEPSEIGKRTV